MTYKELAENILSNFNDEQLNSTVTIYNELDDMFFPVNRNVQYSTYENDILDESHPYLIIC